MWAIVMKEPRQACTAPKIVEISQYDCCTMVRVHQTATRKSRCKPWHLAWRDGLRSGAIASLTSTVALAWCGRCESGSAAAPTNATSHWLWGGHAMREDDMSARYTMVGYAIHHASATFWAVIHERLFGTLADRRELAPAVAGAAAVSGLACLVDYTITPRRLRPGYEQRLSSSSLALVYGVFGAGLLLGAFAGPRAGNGVDTMSTSRC